jgi:hypothetical protein
MTLVSQAASLRANHLPTWTRSAPATSMPNPKTGKNQFSDLPEAPTIPMARTVQRRQKPNQNVVNTLTSPVHGEVTDQTGTARRWLKVPNEERLEGVANERNGPLEQDATF